MFWSPRWEKSLNLEAAVERIRECDCWAVWLGATTRQGRPLQGGVTTPDGPAIVQSDA